MSNNANKKAAYAGLWYTIGNVLIKGLSFLTLPVFTRLLTPADYGIYTTYIAYESVLALIIGLGLYASFKNAKIELDDIDNYVSSTLLLPILFSVILLILVFPFREFIGDFFGFNSLLVMLMILQALASVVVTTYNCRVGLDYAYKSFIGISFIASIGNILFSLVFILTICGDAPYIGRILGTFLPLFLIMIYILCVFFEKAKPAFNKKYFKYSLTYSLPLVPHGLSQILLSQFGKIIIQRQIGNTAAGIYGFAYTIALIPQIIIQSLGMVWGPWFFEAYAKGQIEEIRMRANQYVAFFSLITVVLFCVSPEIIAIMADKSYRDSIVIVCPALLGIYFTFMYGLPIEVEYYYKKTVYIAMGTFIAAAINIILCLALIPRYGYEAAVFVTVLTYFFYFLFHMYIAYKIAGEKLPFDTKRMALYITAVILSCILVQFILDFWYLRYLFVMTWCCCIYINHKSFIKNIIRKKKDGKE